MSLDEWPERPVTRVRAFERDGRFLWWRRVPGVEITDAAADGTGVYLAGTMRSDAVVARVTPAGRVAWLRRLAGTVVEDCTDPCEGDECYCPNMEIAFAVTVTPRAVYVAGEAETRFPGQRVQGAGDAFLARFDRSGHRRWIVEFGTRRIDQAFDVGAGHGRVFVVGDTWGPGGGIANFIRAFRPDGSTAWARQEHSANETDALALVGRTLLVGRWWCCGERGSQIVLAGWGLQGRYLWSRRVWGSPKSDWVTGATTLGDLAVFAGGTDGPFQGERYGGEDDVLLLAVRATGELAWFRQDGERADAYATSIVAAGAQLVLGGTVSGRYLGTTGDRSDAVVLRTRAG